jgi:hypothetical protein
VHSLHIESLSLLQTVAYLPGVHVGLEHVLHFIEVVFLNFPVPQVKSHRTVHIAPNAAGQYLHPVLSDVLPISHAGVYWPNGHTCFVLLQLGSVWPAAVHVKFSLVHLLHMNKLSSGLST